MKALVYTDKQKLEVLDVDDPKLVAGDELIEIDSVGICGSDMHAFLGHDERRPAPLILGHEAAGTIVGGKNSGNRVTVNPLVTCGNCDACNSGRDNLCNSRQIISMPPRPGAFAKYLAMPKINLITVPDNISFAKAALTEPIACGWHAVRLAQNALAKPLEEAICLVIGGGAIGLGVALVLKARGAGEVWIGETNELRQKTLTAAGDFKIFNPVAEQGPGKGAVDLIIDGVGFGTTRATASGCAKPGGVIIHIGLGDADAGLDVRRLTLHEITFIGTYTYTRSDFHDTAQAIFRDQLGALDWMETRPLSDGLAAFLDIRSGNVAAPKIILKPE